MSLQFWHHPVLLIFFLEVLLVSRFPAPIRSNPVAFLIIAASIGGILLNAIWSAMPDCVCCGPETSGDCCPKESPN
uniref:Uncharacterized protein n=1 Tax=uncultured marine virus TaxID=186617 RepID=A0A0F7L3M5_9VIRU|nr:hypothetical protein [uncultured marine virus]